MRVRDLQRHRPQAMPWSYAEFNFMLICDVICLLVYLSVPFCSVYPPFHPFLHAYIHILLAADFTVSSWLKEVRSWDTVLHPVCSVVCHSYVYYCTCTHVCVSIPQKREAFYNNILNTALFREFALVNRFVQTESSLTSVHQSLHAVSHVFLCCYI